MRNKTASQLRKEISALDLALKMLRAETEGLRRSTVTMKKAMNAPLALWESHWFDELPKAEQDNINRTASMIASALINKSAPVINQVTSTTPTKVTSKIVTTGKKQTRTPSNAIKRNKPWTKKDDAELMRMVKNKHKWSYIALTLGRSTGACQQRVTIIKNRKK
jgi:hypothetical protein